MTRLASSCLAAALPATVATVATTGAAVPSGGPVSPGPFAADELAQSAGELECPLVGAEIDDSSDDATQFSTEATRAVAERATGREGGRRRAGSRSGTGSSSPLASASVSRRPSRTKGRTGHFAGLSLAGENASNHSLDLEADSLVVRHGGENDASDRAAPLRYETPTLGVLGPVVTKSVTVTGPDGVVASVDLELDEVYDPVDPVPLSNGAEYVVTTQTIDGVDPQKLTTLESVDGAFLRDGEGNADGVHRDLTGDGSVTNSDDNAFFANYLLPEVDGYPDAYDVTVDGEVGHGDVVALFEYVTEQKLHPATARHSTSHSQTAERCVTVRIPL